MVNNKRLKCILIIGCIFGTSVDLHANNAKPNPLSPNSSNRLIFDQTNRENSHDLCVIHAIPKCGTHYIERTIHLMTDQQIILSQISAENLQSACINNQIIRIFFPYSEKTAEILKLNRHKIIALVRDPRDALISHAFYMRTFANRPGDNIKRDFFRVGKDYDTLSFEQQIDSLIEGGEHSNSYINYYLDRLGWALNQKSLTIKYEDLVGNSGGGNDELKKAAVLKIVKFIHLNLSEEKMQFVLDNMYVDFGEKALEDKIFERSSIGNWRKFLNNEQIELIKKKIGKEIIQLGYEKNNNW